MTWTPERDFLRPEERPDRVVVTIDGPFRAEGFSFPGCSNWSGPAHTCTCETWEGVECRTCREEITDGEWIVTKTVRDEYGDGWEIRAEAWHRQCPTRKGAAP